MSLIRQVAVLQYALISPQDVGQDEVFSINPFCKVILHPLCSLRLYWIA